MENNWDLCRLYRSVMLRIQTSLSTIAGKPGSHLGQKASSKLNAQSRPVGLGF